MDGRVVNSTTHVDKLLSYRNKQHSLHDFDGVPPFQKEEMNHVQIVSLVGS